MARKNMRYGLLLLLLYACLFCNTISGDDSETLLKFKSSLTNSSALNNWDAKVGLCDWNGVLCSNGSFYGLRLENMSLGGVIDVDSLGELSVLRTMSFMNNTFDGPFPGIRKLGALRGFYISDNNFSGEIPDDAFAGLNSMRRVFLANNMFTGNIPRSLGKLPRLAEVQLQGNQFVGKIPAGLRGQNPNAFFSKSI